MVKFDKVIFLFLFEDFLVLFQKINKGTKWRKMEQNILLIINCILIFWHIFISLCTFCSVFGICMTLYWFFDKGSKSKYPKNRTKYPRWVKYIRVEYFVLLVIIMETEILEDNWYYMCLIVGYLVFILFFKFGIETKSLKIVQIVQLIWYFQKNLCFVIICRRIKWFYNDIYLIR